MFLIRADGNAKIGAGHLMRCMTIAEELAALEGRDVICFVCADEESAAFAGENGFRAHVLGTDYRDMESELPGWRELVRMFRTGEEAVNYVLLVDSYFVTDFYLKELGRLGRVVLMDDMGGHTYPVNGVVNYNATADSAYYSRLYEGRDVKLFVGSSYVPVRRQFRNLEYLVSDQVRNVLLTTGGGDSENIAGRILRHIWDVELRFHLVTGRFNPHFAELKELAESRGNIAIYHDVKDMASLMRKCDMAVTAGGSTVYELAALGVPFVCFSYAENQEEVVDYLGNSGIAAAAGKWHRDSDRTLSRIVELFDELRADRKKREVFSLRERAMVDGEGAGRLAESLDKIWRTH